MLLKSLWCVEGFRCYQKIIAQLVRGSCSCHHCRKVAKWWLNCILNAGECEKCFCFFKWVNVCEWVNECMCVEDERFGVSVVSALILTFSTALNNVLDYINVLIWVAFARIILFRSHAHLLTVMHVCKRWLYLF